LKSIILEGCEKEINKFPDHVIDDFLDIVEQMENGLKLAPKISKRMQGIGLGVFELRLKDRNGIYRIIYFLKKAHAIYFIHGFKKKTQKTPKKNIDLARKRIRRIK